MIRILKWFSVGLLSLIVIILLIGAWLLNTESGLRWAVRQAPDVINIKTIQGSLNNLRFEGLKVRLDGMDVAVSSGKLKWDLFPLFTRRIHIDSLHVNNITITSHSSELSNKIQPYEPWQGLQLPINAQLNSLQVNDLTLQSKSPENSELIKTLELDKVTVQLTFNNNILDIKKLKIIESDNTAQISGDIDLSAQADTVINLKNSTKWQLGEYSIDNSGTISGTWSRLEAQQSTMVSSTNQAPIQSQLSLVLSNALSDNISWEGKLLTSAADVNLTLAKETVQHQDLHLGSGDFSFNGAIRPAEGLTSLISQINGEVSASHDQYSKWSLNTQVSIENDVLDITRFELNEFAQESHRKSDQKPSLKKHQNKQGHLIVHGRVNGLSNFLAQTRNSSAHADLKGQWKSLSWPLNRDNTETVLSNSHGSFVLRGHADDFKFTANADGESYSNQLTTDIDIRVLPQIIELNTVKFQTGETELDISGQLGESLALNWHIVSPDLSVISPNLSGDFKSQGQLKGTRTHPQFDGSASSKQFRFNDIVISGVALSGKGALSSNNDDFFIKGNISDVQQASANVANNLNIDLSGSGKNHKLSISSQLFGQSDFKLNARGGISRSGWSGNLDTLELSDPFYDTWKLSRVVPIKRNGDKLITDLLCLNNLSQSLCVQFNANSTKTNISAIIKDVDLNNLNPLLSLYDATASGLINGDFNYLKSNTDNAATIDAKLDSLNSVINFKQLQGQAQQLKFASVSAIIRQQNTLLVDGNLQLQNGDRVDINLNVDAAIEDPGFSSAPLNGNIIAQLDDLTAVKAAIPMLSNLNGSFNSDIKISGSFDVPKVAMQTQLNDANLAIPDLGLNLKSINLVATSSDKQRIVLIGSLNSGKGTLNIDGSLDFAKLNDPQVQLSIKGQQLELMKTPEILIDGDVDLNIAVNNTLLDLSGSVNLTQADLDFQPPENAILASEDVVLLGLEDQQKAMQTQMNLSLNLGDKTHIRAQGLDAFLVGRLQILQEAGGILRGKGQIDVKQGRFDAYNQKLKIDKGQLIFSGGSIDDPALDMRAQKTVNDITAGVGVTGRANAPILRLYSNPSMADQDILSVLIFDKKLGKLGSQDGFTLLKIANSLRGSGESQVDALTERIQDSLGLSNLELQLDGDAPSVLAGKQLSSKFYIGYGYGLLDAAQSLILRYKINKAWSIQGDVGADSGADLRYQIER